MYRGPTLCIVQPISSPSPDMHARLVTPHGSFGSSFQTRTKAFLSSFGDNDILLWRLEPQRLPISNFLFCCCHLSFRILCEHSFQYNFERPLSMAAPTQSLTPAQSHTAYQALLNGPAASPPAGVLPNFKNPPQNLPSIFRATAALTLSFATVAVVIRIYTKRCLIRSMGYEDCMS